MNSLVQRVRKMLDDVGGRARSPAGARRPRAVELRPHAAHARDVRGKLGCDVPAWAKHGWVDFVTVSEFLFERGDLPDRLVEAGHHQRPGLRRH